jgi:Family of unknown function (DUF5906)
MTEFAKARDWLGELQALVAADQLEAFQALVKETLEARPDLEDKVFAMTAEYMASPKKEKPGDFFYPTTLPKDEAEAQVQPKPVPETDWAAERARLNKKFEALGAKPKPEADPEPAKPEPEEVAAPKATGTALVRTTGGLPVVEGSGEPEAIKEVNDKHAVISNLGGKCVVMEWAPSAIKPGAKELAYQSFTSFRERYANRYVALPNNQGRIVGVPMAPLWLAHPQRRQYEGLDLVPNGPSVLPGNYLNLWRGWGVDPEKGSWRLLRRHVAEVLANGDQRFEDFIIKKTAWKFQNPGLPPEVVLALLGGKGAGKGAWGYALMLIYGEHGLQIFSADHLYGKHNAHLQNKLFLFLDEAIWAGDKEGERVLKGLTTEKWMMIEPKNINAFQWPNRLDLLMSGNDKWIVPASHDERRYAVNRIDERWKQNKSYFDPLFDEINNGGAAAMLYDLLHLDLDGWHPRDNVPQTKALIEQKLLGLTGLEQWYVHKLSVGELRGADQKNPRRVLAKHLMEDAKNHSPRNRFTTPDELGRFMREQGCEHKSNGKNWGWVFPPLAEAREAWLARAGGNWEWLAPEISDWGEKPVEEEGS